MTTRYRSIWFYYSVCFVIGVIAMVLQHGSYDVEIWAAHRGIVALLFMAFGGLYWRYEEEINHCLKWYIIVLMIVIFLVVLFNTKNHDPNISVLALQP